MQDLVGVIENTTTEANGMKFVLRVREAVQVRKLLSIKKLQRNCGDGGTPPHLQQTALRDLISRNPKQKGARADGMAGQ